MLKHGANLESAFVSHNLLHPDERLRMDYHAMPQAIFRPPQLAGVGETEESLRTAVPLDEPSGTQPSQ